MRLAAILFVLAAIGLGASTVDGARSMVAETDRTASAAKTPPGLLLTVVSRDGVVNPGNTSTVTALCGRTQVAFSWGFTTISFPAAGGFNNALLRAVVPIVRRNGLVAGWTATFSNPAAVPLSVRLQATCARAQGGLKFRGTGERAVQTTTGGGELVFTLLRIEGVVEPNTRLKLTHRCPDGSIPLSVTFDLMQGLNVEVTELDLGLITLDNPSSEPQQYVIRFWCVRGSNPKTLVHGAGDPAPTPGQLVLGTAMVKTLVVGGNTDPKAVGFGITCATGANLGIGHQLAGNAAPPIGEAPRQGAGAHAAKMGADGGFEVRRRFDFFVPSGPAAVPLNLFSACLKSANVKILADGSVRLLFPLPPPIAGRLREPTGHPGR